MEDKERSRKKASKFGFADRLSKARSAISPSIEEEAKRAQGLAEKRSQAAIDDFEDTVLPVERATISEQRKARGFTPTVEDEYTGLALSGGGIRSASFALGVLEALHASGELKKVDYLSTVSGGGYMGTAYSWSLRKAKIEDQKLRGAFPLDPYTDRSGSKDEHEPWRESTIDFIRQHGDYLRPSRKYSTIHLLAALLRNILVAGILHFGLMVLVWIAIFVAGNLVVNLFPELPKRSFFDLAIVPTVLLIAAFLAYAMLYAPITWIYMRFFPRTQKLYYNRLKTQRRFGALLGLIAITAVFAGVHYAFDLQSKLSLAAGGGFSGAALGGALWQFFRRKSSEAIESLSSTIRIVLTAACLWAGLLLLAYAMAKLVVGTQTDPLAILLDRYVIWIGLAILIPMLLIDLNMFGIGRMYRDRLMETFMPSTDTVAANTWSPATSADRSLLIDWGGEEHTGPYHIINTNVILRDSNCALYKGRAGDNFVMSHHFCGGDAVGWHESSDFCNGNMSWATAMAISGAAVNPNTGTSTSKVTRNRMVAMTLAFFNLRLGYILPNPASQPGSFSFRYAVKMKLRPSLIYPGLRAGILGRGMHEYAGYLELSDGGHFDNSGVYELVRRRCKTIILSLASADPENNAGDLAELIRKVRVDFGVILRFRKDAIADLTPGTRIIPRRRTHPVATAKRAYAIGEIEYPNGMNGKIVVIKATMTRGLPVDLVSYRKSNPIFPNQSTTDQFFDEAQVEAYRVLGYEQGKRAVAAYKESK